MGNFCLVYIVTIAAFGQEVKIPGNPREHRNAQLVLAAQKSIYSLSYVTLYKNHYVLIYL